MTLLVVMLSSSSAMAQHEGERAVEACQSLQAVMCDRFVTCSEGTLNPTQCAMVIGPILACETAASVDQEQLRSCIETLEAMTCDAVETGVTPEVCLSVMLHVPEDEAPETEASEP